jgi:hypothetical protein
MIENGKFYEVNELHRPIVSNNIDLKNISSMMNWRQSKNFRKNELKKAVNGDERFLLKIPGCNILK